MDASGITRELKSRYGASEPDRLTEADVLRWSTSHGWSRSGVFQAIAIFLAYGFDASELSFEFCDAIVNDLFSPFVDTSPPKSELFWNVYLAFDEGEYYHGNDQTRDPVETYTRPMIAEIVKGHRRTRATLVEAQR